MATKAEILAILRRGTSGLSESDLDTLAGQLSSAGAGRRGTGDSLPVTEAELKARQELLESMGEMNRARQLEQDYVEAQIEAKRAEIALIQSQTAATQAATDAARENTEASEENAEATQNETEVVQAATKSAEELKKELQQLQRRKAAIAIEAKQTSKAFEFLGGVISNTTKEFAEIGDTGVNVAGVFKSLKGASKDLHGTMLNLASSDVVQGFAQQADALNILTSEVQKAFEMASKLDTMNSNLYKSMGIAEVGTEKFSFQLAKLADETSSLSRTGEETSRAAMALQRAQKSFDRTSARDMGLVKQIALLEKAGISAELAAENIVLYQKSGLPLAAEADTINLKLLAIARELGQAPEQVAASLSSVAAYGDRATTVFSRMLAMSEKLSVSVDDMLNKMGSLDDIDAAQRVAGRINQILQLTGEDVLQGFELASMDDPEKFQRIQEALTSDQAQRMIGAGTGRAGMLRVKELEKLGILSAEQIRKVMKTPAEDLAKAGQDISKITAMSLEELDALNASQLTVSEASAKRNEMVTKNLIDTAQATREAVGVGMSGMAGKVVLGAIGTGLSLGLPLLLRGKGGGGALAGGAAGVAASLAGAAAQQGASESSGGALPTSVTILGEPTVNLSRATIDALAAGGLGGGGGGLTDIATKGIGRKLATAASTLTAVAMIGKDAFDIAISEGPAKKEDIGGVTGGAIGAIAGGIIGSIIPGVGTAIGAGIGGTLGNFAGNYFGAKADNNTSTVASRGEFRRTAGGLTSGLPTAPGTGQTGNDFRINSSDEIVGVKEGGLIAKKLDRLISIMSGNGAPGGGAQDIVVQIDGNEVGRAAVKSINNNFYNMRN